MQTSRVLGKHADAASRTAAFYMAIRAPTVGIFLFRVTSHGVRHSRVPPPKRPQKSLDGSWRPFRRPTGCGCRSTTRRRWRSCHPAASRISSSTATT